MDLAIADTLWRAQGKSRAGAGAQLVYTVRYRRSRKKEAVKEKTDAVVLRPVLS
jgi:hypothetical protein